MENLLKDNYIMCLGYIQKAYLLAYSSALLILSMSLTATKENGLQSFPVPFFDIELPRLVGVFATLSIYIMIGFVMVFLNGQLSAIKVRITPELASALETYPAVSHTSKLFQVAIVVGLLTIFVVLFKTGQKPMAFTDAVGSAVTVSLGYLFSLMPNKWLKRTAKSAAA